MKIIAKPPANPVHPAGNIQRYIGDIFSVQSDSKENPMATTFLKRQKEMKRLEKQREKAERRAQKKLAQRAQKELPAESTLPAADEDGLTSGGVPSESVPQN